MRTKSSTSSSWKNLDSNANITTTTTTTKTGDKLIGPNIIAATTTQLLIMRPNTLNVSRERNFNESKILIREAINAWRIRAKQNYVPADKLLELFQEFKVYPTEEQVNEMLHTAKLFARRSNNFDSTGTRLQVNGVTFGEFCVLLADLKRFRTFSIIKHDKKTNEENSYLINNNNNNSNNNNNNNNNIKNNNNDKNNSKNNRSSLTSQPQPKQQQSHQINSKILQLDNTLSNNKQINLNIHNNEEEIINLNNPTSSDRQITGKTHIEQSTSTTTLSSDSSTGPEVFLGGSCNPTTWRADVAIPALNDLGISFYNPQVSDWTPDLIELEHRAKEKARVLFFVMDSETRASAGAIEAAHIAGQNARQLVLVLHPYKPQQSILNEPVSSQEYIDLARNQQLLRELVSRRGLPVLDSIPSGLQRTKAILAGNHGRDQPTNVASRLISVRRAFDRVVGASEDTINRIQCQKALSCLGIPNNILSLNSLNQIILYINDIKLNKNQLTSIEVDENIKQLNEQLLNDNQQENPINFDDFCIIAAYLQVLQQEINNSTCISPIKGINVPPPPIFFTNTPEFIHCQTSRCHNDDSLTTTTTTILNRSNSGEKCRNIIDERLDYKLNRDSGTSSPQPINEQIIKTTNIFLNDQQKLSKQNIRNKGSKITVNVEIINNEDEDDDDDDDIDDIDDDEHNIDNHNINDDDSDSTDSVFSSGSSDDLNLLEGTMTTTTTTTTSHINKSATTTRTKTTITARKTNTRDLYLGGSCQLRTRWRQDYIIPYLKAKGISYYLSNLHESINNKTFNYVYKNDCNPITSTPTSNIQNKNDTQKLPHSEKRLKYNTNMNDDNTIINDNINHDITATLTTTNLNNHNTDNIDNNDNDNNDDDKNDNDENTKNIIKNNNLNLSEFPIFGKSLFNPILLDSSRVLFFFITNETRSLAPMTLAAHYIGLGYNVILCVQMLPDFCKIGNETLTPSAIKDYNRGRAYLIDLAKRQGIPVFNDPQEAIECAIEKVKMCKSRHSI